MLIAILMNGCVNKKAALPETQTEGLKPIDIKAPKFFWMLQPWKEGKLATIDGWGRYAEISFVGANKIKITALVDFPRAKQDEYGFITYPEAGIITSTTGKMHHIAWIDGKKTKSHIPLLSWVHQEFPAVLLDSKEGLVVYGYSLERNKNDVNKSLFIYNYKEDRMINKSNDELPYLPIIAMDEKYALSYHTVLDESGRHSRKVFYNWRTSEAVENELSRTIDKNKYGLSFNPLRNIHVPKRFLFMYVNEQKIKITWDENYSDVKVTPISYLIPKGKSFGDFTISADGNWATTYVSGYSGSNIFENLSKRAFFHLDERYPNGISLPVITDDYERYNQNAFVNHPVHGMCFAQEWHKKENGKDKLYLCLYKMSDVLAEINKRE